jgi:hypothetical protein
MATKKIIRSLTKELKCYDEGKYTDNIRKGASCCIPCDMACKNPQCKHPSIVAIDGKKGFVKGNVQLILCCISKLHMNLNGEKTLEECGDLIKRSRFLE